MLTLFTTLALATGSLGALINTNFILENNEIAPDGFARGAITTNGQFHGPTIFATKGDDVHVNVINNLDDPNMRRSTSIHWHGLVQKRTNHYDGPAFVSQCPIPPAMSFEYRLHMEDGGTFWYHSHLSSQYLDGLKGAIVVYDPNDPHLDLYDVDDENTVITLSDWWHEYAPIATEEWLSPTNTGGIESVPDSGLINSKGRYVGGTAEPWSVINVEQGKKYRLRIVNTSGIARFRFQIQGHQLTVIEADGVSHEPLVVDFVDVYPGQRYSVILDASQAIENYWIRAPMTIRNSNTNPNLDVNNVNAILRYAGALIQDPTSTPATPTGVALVEASMVPVVPGTIGNVPADKVFNLAFTRVTETDGLKFKINGQQYLPPSLPTLLQILNGATANSDFAASENTFVIEKDDIVEINITGAPGHPFHLHGHFFEVVQSATGARNVINPPRRDVVASGGSGITMRFKADNPGPWILHCHIDLHFEAGLAAVFAEAPSETVSGPQSVNPGQDWFGLCPAYQALPAELQ